MDRQNPVRTRWNGDHLVWKAIERVRFAYSQTKSKATRQSLIERMKERQGFTKVFLEPSPFFLNGI